MKFLASKYGLAGLVVCALLALAGVASLSSPATLSAASPGASPRTVPASLSFRACPSPGVSASGAASVAVVAATSRGRSGTAAISRLIPAGGSPSPALGSVSQPGTLAVIPVPGDNPARGSSHGSAAIPESSAVMIAASGAMAQGLAAEQASSGVVTAACASPGTDFWFAMPGQQSAAVIQLVLMNVDGQASQADASLYTDAGPVQTAADTGIVVPAHGVVIRSLSGLVHGSRAVALHIATSAGRVVAAVRESTQSGQPGQWLPPSEQPARHLVIPGLPPSAGQREFYIADPGVTDATVRLTAVTPGGAYDPAGTGVIDVPAGSASMVEVPSLASVAGAAVLTANVPVTASMVVPGGGRDAPGAVTAAVPALQQQGVVADAGQDGEVTTLVLSAPGRAARVGVRAGARGLTAGAGQPGAVRIVSVPARHSISIKIARPSGLASGTSFAIVLTPLARSGPVYAARVLAASGGGVIAIIPVASALTQVPLPPVRDSLSAIAP